MLPIPQRLLGEALLFSADKYPNKTAIIVKDRQYTYDMLCESAENLALYLISIGVVKGDRVAIYLDNSWESIVALYGATLSGSVFMFINPQTKSDKLNYILQDSGAKVLISSINLYNEFSSALENNHYINEVIIAGKIENIDSFDSYNINLLDYTISNHGLNAIIPNIIPNDLAALIYTSGSTGFPKGVMMTHQSMVFASWSLIEYLRLSPEDRIMLMLPLAFDYGLYQLLMSVTIGGTFIVEQSFIFTASIFKNIEKYQPTVFPGVPTVYAMMIAANKQNPIKFNSIQKVTNTAAALPAEFIPELKKIFPNALIFKMYGLTECKRVCFLEPELIDLKPTSVGKAIPGTEIFLLSSDGNPVSIGEPGILYIRGPHIMAGYWHKEELSTEMLMPGYIPGEKILCSNDWFKMDEDGDLYFLGRNDDIIKTRGEKVSPVEIENVIYRMDGVKEVAVMGIPDPIMGESIIVYLTTHDSSDLNEKEIQRHCMNFLEQYMIPKKVFIIDEMPKSSNGKINKKELVLDLVY